MSRFPHSGSDVRHKISPPAITLPKGGGALRGMGEKFAANPATGTGALSVPIATSPSRSGFGPQLALSYDSGAGNGPFGLGWMLSLPAITRKTDKGLPQYCDAEESDVFVLSGAEDLVPVVTGTGARFEEERGGFIVHRYRPRVEGLFARIERWTEKATGVCHWRSITRDNVTSVYGADEKSRIYDPSEATPAKRIFSWLICQSYDDDGNAIVYQYLEENADRIDRGHANERNRVSGANRYLKRVKYGNRVSRRLQPDLSQATWMFEVVFDYGEGHQLEIAPDPSIDESAQHRFVHASSSEAEQWAVRPDPFSSYRSGFEVRTCRRCLRVLMFHHIPDVGPEEPGYDGLVGSTEFDYEDLELQSNISAEQELAHPGSTRFASFIRGVTQSGYVRQDEPEVTSPGGAVYATYLKKSLPSLQFEYSKARIDDDLKALDPASAVNLPEGIDGGDYQLVDLDGEGLSGILSEQAGGWFYKSSLGDGRFGPSRPITPKPSLADLRQGRQQLLDLAGDGQLDLADFSGSAAGFYERADKESWATFRTFSELPELQWQDPNLRFVDLNGDGHADILIAGENELTWHPSLAEAGFGPARRVMQPDDDERGPRLLLSDGADSLFLADMSGDGLTDLVRIRNGEVCYWPNLGHGRFGAKVALDNSPWFDRSDQFDRRRLRLADIDGSGTNDIIYLADEGARLYFNQSGNRLSDPQVLSSFRCADPSASVMAADLFGNGTACLLWSSPLEGDARHPIRFMDLMGGIKPHLLVKATNNLGAETHIHYAPSTKFYLADKQSGAPWLTRLPFPVHVVERVETHDRVSGSLFVSRYAYHHGYFDGTEREFRGFGMVERLDTEEFEALSQRQPDATNIEATSHVPPVHTKTWFHTGAYLGRAGISAHLAGLVDPLERSEYYRPPNLSDDEYGALLLADTELPPGLTPEEEREACRALKGTILREEVFALDGSAEDPHPYSVTEQISTVRTAQLRGGNRHAVFLVHPRESLCYHYERDPEQPRVSHALTMETDDFGNVLKSAAIGYGRREADPDLPGSVQAQQLQTSITVSENRVTNFIDEPDAHRAPVICEQRLFELSGIGIAPGRRFALEDVSQAVPDAVAIDYETDPTSGLVEKRLIQHQRVYFRSDDLSGALALGEQGSHARVDQTYLLAFTPGLLELAFDDRVDADMMREHGRYTETEGQAGWWIPSGRTLLSPDPGHSAAQELAFAIDHFFLPHRLRDPFGADSFFTYDEHRLLLTETRDALQNRVTAGERARGAHAAKGGNDYRVLQAALVMDPNRNRTALAFDALGMVAGTAVMGKPEDAPAEGDRLTPPFSADLTQARLDAFFDDPSGTSAALLLDQASSRALYDLFAFQREPQRAAFTATIARETHVSDLAPDEQSSLQITFSYSDGFGRAIQKKTLAEAGPVPVRDAEDRIVVDADGQPQMSATDAPTRWVGTGWTIFNNKGAPVRQYEPFFSDRHLFEFDVRTGVSPIMMYDAAGRAVAILHPNHSWEKVVFDPWRQVNWDVHDTVLIADPRGESDVGGFFQRLPEAEYLPSWHALRTQPGEAAVFAARYPNAATRAAETEAARKSEVHAGTFRTAYADSLGRTVATVAHNRFMSAGATVDEQHVSRVILDITGNQREVRDALGRIVMRYDYDMLGRPVRDANMEAGERRVLPNAASKPILSWNSRGQRFRSTYDELGRPAELRLQEEGSPDERVIGRASYGESAASPEVANLRGRVLKTFDQAGIAANLSYDFKGNLTASERRLARDYEALLDWANDPPVELEAFQLATAYDALDRPIAVTTPDGSLHRRIYNEAGLLDRVEVALRGAQTATPFVTNVSYDARGRRVAIDHGNGARTTSQFDRQTSRLARLTTVRDSARLQDLAYCYDAAGNITRIEDAAQQPIYFSGQVVGPDCGYTYDALYRLIGAEGREHIGQGGPPESTWHDSFRIGQAHPHDGQAMRRYTEQYEYDAAGNLLECVHKASLNGEWTRHYDYAEASLIEPAKLSNRLSRTRVGSSASEDYGYDAHGCLLKMAHLPRIDWDFADRLRQGDLLGGGTVFHVYDAAGERVRKVVETNGGALIEERIYLGGFEVYRKRTGAGALLFQRETLHVMDDSHRLATVETRTIGSDAAPLQLIRYQYSNQLGSAHLELDDQGRVLSYEEYHPYGTTSFQSHATGTPKRYRYSGMERDEETGFNYHGARYYASWLGRWISCDPSGIQGGINLYLFCKANPVSFSDMNGRDPSPISIGEAGDLAPNATLDEIKAYARAKGKRYEDPGNQRRYDSTRKQWRGGTLTSIPVDPSTAGQRGAGSESSDKSYGKGESIKTGGYKTNPNSGGDYDPFAPDKPAGSGKKIPGSSRNGKRTSGPAGGSDGGSLKGTPGGAPGKEQGDRKAEEIGTLTALASIIVDIESLAKAKESKSGSGSPVGSAFGFITGDFASFLTVLLAVVTVGGGKLFDKVTSKVKSAFGKIKDKVRGLFGGSKPRIHTPEPKALPAKSGAPDEPVPEGDPYRNPGKPFQEELPPEVVPPPPAPTPVPTEEDENLRKLIEWGPWAK